MAERLGLPQARVGLPVAPLRAPSADERIVGLLRGLGMPAERGALDRLQQFPGDVAHAATTVLPDVAKAGVNWARENPVDAGVMAAGLIPGTWPFADIAGAANDARHLWNEPESRTWLNYGGALAGLLPVIPGISQIARSADDVGRGVKRAASIADDLPMDEASRMARAREMGFDVDAYHGTQSPVDFSEFNTGGSIQDEMGELFDSGSGADPSSFMGAHFALEPGPANKFAEGRGASWMKARVIEGAGDGAGGRVLPVKVRGKFKEFADDDAVQAYIYRQPVNSDDVEEAIMQRVDYDEDAASALFSQYENSPTFREEINRDVMDTLMRESDDGGREFADELGSAARMKLEEQGFDGFRHKNTVEGGTAVAVFDPKNIRSRFAKFDPRKADSGDIMAGVGGLSAAALAAGLLAHEPES
jgi:hypothetical protein